MPLRAARISIHVHVLDGLSAGWLMIPQRFIYRTLLFLLFVAVVVGALHQVIWTAFQHNPWLNGVILAILLFGVFFNIRRILRLKPEASWIDAFRTNAPGFSLQSAPRLLAPIAAVLGERQRRSRTALSTLSLRHLLDSISSRLDENRDISGYLRNLLIFLGLLGTFWGLIQAIGSISGVTPGVMRPRASSASIIDTPMRSLTDESGLKNSSFKRTCALFAGTTLFSRTSGVWPMVSVMLS